ncbi:hypothetical protein GCM10022408_28090 [Hymenobacter fastidiosus]|uniref:VPDSG-CTERM protein sorting domain-containing protein n=1 Tax=Hymenobacter fastidiosus TaxID=486264 RepID=A0ABP7SLD5_9BACT
MIKPIISRIAICVVVLGCTQLPVLAQGPGLGGPKPGATNVPIDGGASLLLAGGVALGLRRLRRR